MRQKTLFFLLSFFIFHLSLSSAQTSSISQMSIVGKPQKSTSEFVGSSIRDVNGRICAMIKVISDMDGFKYQSYNGVVKVDDQPGEDRVYLPPDERVLEIYKSGYEPLKLILSEYGIQLHPKEVWVLKISGENKMSQIPVAVITNPGGARVFVNGKDMGLVEKLNLNRGAHSIRLIKQGYEPIVKTIQVDKNNTLFKFNLKEIEDVPLQITSVPSGATVYIDNVKFGVTPLSDFYTSGKYPIRVEKEWYVTYEDFIDIKAPETRKAINLREDFGSLTVTSAPQSGLDIYMNGNSIRSKTPQTIKRLRPGTYRVKAKSKFYETQEQTIEIRRGQKQNLNLASENNFAVLNINTLPGARIYLNDKRITSLKNIRLEPAIVRVRAEMPPKGKTVEKRVVLKKNETKTIDIKPLIPTGTIQVAVFPFDAEITLKGDAGEFYTANKSKAFKHIPVGTYDLTVKKDGYKTQTAKLVLAEHKTIKRSIRLQAGSNATSVNNTITGNGNAFVKSLFIPGWGQISNGHKRGALYTIFTIAATGWYVGSYIENKDNMDAYNKAKADLDENKTLKNALIVNEKVKKVNESYKNGMTALYVLGGVYAINLLDAMLFSSKSERKTYSISPYINSSVYAYEPQPLFGVTLKW